VIVRLNGTFGACDRQRTVQPDRAALVIGPAPPGQRTADLGPLTRV
jgi:hypothetical protein